MKVKLLSLFIALMVFAILSPHYGYMASMKTPEEPISNSNCFSNQTLQTFLDDNEYQLLFRGMQDSGKWFEMWSDFEGRHTLVTEYDPPPDDDYKKAEHICVSNITRHTTYNLKAMEKLIDWYNKLIKKS